VSVAYVLKFEYLLSRSFRWASFSFSLMVAMIAGIVVVIARGKVRPGDRDAKAWML